MIRSRQYLAGVALLSLGAAACSDDRQPSAPTAAGGVPTRDIAVGPEGSKLTLGDTTIEIVATPGHTPGTLSYVFPVKDQGRTVTVAYSGGTLTGAFGAGRDTGFGGIALMASTGCPLVFAGAILLIGSPSLNN